MTMAATDGMVETLYAHSDPAQLLDFANGVDRFAPGTFEQAMVAVYSTSRAVGCAAMPGVPQRRGVGLRAVCHTR